MIEYNEKLTDFGDLFTVEEFIELCKSGGFIDYDGFGYPVKNKKMNSDFIIFPSEFENIPKDATHIIWYNR